MTARKKSTNVRFHTASVAAVRLGLQTISVGAPDLAASMAMRLFTTARRHPTPAWEAEVLHDATRAWLAHGDGRLPVYVFGEPGRPRILLVHGWEGRGSQLGAFVAPLLERGFQVVTFDAPGHGGSTLTRGSLVDHARAIVDVAATFGPLHGVVAHSMGGAAALLATRMGLEVNRLVLVAAPATPAGYLLGFRKILGLPADVERRMVAKLEAELDFAFDALDVTADAARIDARLLVVHDTSDREVPASEGRRIRDASPRAAMLETEGLGHRRILRAPGVIEAATDFLTAGAPGHANDTQLGVARLSNAPSTFERTIEGELYFREARWS